jgi:hypothetical protein
MKAAPARMRMMMAVEFAGASVFVGVLLVDPIDASASKTEADDL